MTMQSSWVLTLTMLRLAMMADNGDNDFDDDENTDDNDDNVTCYYKQVVHRASWDPIIVMIRAA